MLGLLFHGDAGHQQLEAACQNGDQDQADDGPGQTEIGKCGAGRGGQVQAQEVVIQVDPAINTGSRIGRIFGDGLHQVDLSVRLQLAMPLLTSGRWILLWALWRTWRS